LMRRRGLAGVVCGRKFKVTTTSDAAAGLTAGAGGTAVQGHAVEPAVLADLTYLATWRGFVYVASVIDVFWRPIEAYP